MNGGSGMGLNPEIKERMSSSDTWAHGFFVLVFYVVLRLFDIILLVIAVFQFVHALIVGRANDRLVAFSRSANAYLYQICNFLTYVTDEKPFPFGAWPQSQILVLGKEGNTFGEGDGSGGNHQPPGEAPPGC